ncbi:MAG: isocitrate/isopropylmalate family dehydrogenase, partial [Gammaproteobacteria bacterium]
MMYKLAILPGDGIGPEIVAEAEKVLAVLGSESGLDAELGHAPVGGAAYDAHGHPLPAATLELVR